MTNLSPTAQAVLDVAFAVEDEWDTIPMIAAALRAAAFQLSFGHATGSGILCEDDLYALAAELDGGAQ
jgi:hypothetical protein